MNKNEKKSMATRHISAQSDWDFIFQEVTDAFSPGAPVQEKDLFAGRAAQILSLHDAVLQRGRHAIVYGERGVGKTSLANILRLVMHRPNKEVIYVRVNADPNDTFTSLWTKVFKRISFAVEVEGVLQNRTFADDITGPLSPDDVQLLLSNFSPNQTPIIVLDEFDRILDKSVTTQVADTIKSLSDYSTNATVIIVGVAEDVSSLILGHNSITRSLIQVQMPRMSTDELSEIILTRFKRCGVKTDEDAVWKMVFLSRGLPYYTHLLAMHSARYCIEKKSLFVGHDDVDQAIGRSLSELDQSIKERYHTAVKSQRGETLYASVLLACALTPPDELGQFQQSAVASSLNRLIPGKNYLPSTYALHMNSFCEEERGCVLQRFGSSRNFRYRFADPMMQPFVILKGLDEGRLNDAVAQVFANRRQLNLGI
ncbi:Cdc6-like AAA superfamily ATPase [Herbaspirillum sp. 1173]|uniref:nSTAND1 domain-containing NTPase n=1 Tax=unclassified Herbaspirillum TaxID=2624150 RepID=UPI001AE867A1|nr:MULTISPECIES: AAA family ATPase [unclassified Herbaspirillum]MBP1314370.1 Cdc6-like AAA superfamily ATPase [Herbaspirillum sp. 1130]MDR6743079.1 Cdc6-like AAA superfamily ATPase [Herbaspirillum sp. 1173]